MAIKNGKRVCIVEIGTKGVSYNFLKNMWLAEYDDTDKRNGNLYFKEAKPSPHWLKKSIVKNYHVCKQMVFDLDRKGMIRDEVNVYDSNHKVKGVRTFLIFKTANGAIDYLVTNWLAEKLVVTKNVFAAAKAITNVRLWM